MSPQPVSTHVPESAATRLISRFGRQFTAGDVLFEDGTPAEEIFLLHEGKVRLLRRTGPAERTLRLVKAGEIFGECALQGGLRRSSWAVALTDGVALVLDRATFDQVVSANPAVGARVVAQLVVRLREAEDQLELLSLHDRELRVATALDRLAELRGTEREDGSVALPCTPMELATRVGLPVEQVRRIVTQLSEAGHLGVDHEQITLPQPATLRDLVELLRLKEHLGPSTETSATVSGDATDPRK